MTYTDITTTASKTTCSHCHETTDQPEARDSYNTLVIFCDNKCSARYYGLIRRHGLAAIGR